MIIKRLAAAITLLFVASLLLSCSEPPKPSVQPMGFVNGDINEPVTFLPFGTTFLTYAFNVKYLPKGTLVYHDWIYEGKTTLKPWSGLEILDEDIHSCYYYVSTSLPKGRLLPGYYSVKIRIETMGEEIYCIPGTVQLKADSEIEYTRTVLSFLHSLGNCMSEILHAFRRIGQMPDADEELEQAFILMNCLAIRTLTEYVSTLEAPDFYEDVHKNYILKGIYYLEQCLDYIEELIANNYLYDHEQYLFYFSTYNNLLLDGVNLLLVDELDPYVEDLPIFNTDPEEELT